MTTGQPGAEVRKRVHAFLIERGPLGATAQEIENGMRLSGDTVRPRLVELRKVWLVVTRGKRPTRSGRKACVWMDAEAARLHKAERAQPEPSPSARKA